MTTSACAAIVLAAGAGTRMHSNRPKVLQPIANRPMISYLLDTVSELAPERTIVVVGPGMEAVKEEVSPLPTVEQTQRLGTCHAVLTTFEAMKDFSGDVLILYGDTPLLAVTTISKMLAARRASHRPEIVVLGFRPEDPGEYGRLLTDVNGNLDRIVEHKDASPLQRAIGLCNAGMMVVDNTVLFKLLKKVKNNNGKGEYYLTDIVEIAKRTGLSCSLVEATNSSEVMGINTRSQLAAAEKAIQGRLRTKALDNGVTMTDPETVWLSSDTKFGRDVVIEPNVFFGPDVSIGDDVQVKAFCHIEGAKIASGTKIGPFARLRPGTELKQGVKIGNFVEIKEALVEQNAKINHLSYVGDAFVGREANIGAGTITCNYDGFSKEKTDIGENAFIGSNTALVAPIRIGKGGIVGAGSVITEDVEPDALAIARGAQKNLKQRAKSFRDRRRVRKGISDPK